MKPALARTRAAAPAALSPRAVLGRLINIAGRQRMLSHRAVMFLALARASAEEGERRRLLDSADQAITTFAQAHSAILKGDSETGLPVLTSERVLRLLEKTLPDGSTGAALIERFLNEAKRILAHLQRGQDMEPAALDSLSEIAAADLLDLFTCMTAAFETDLTDAADMEAAKAVEVRNVVTATLENIENLGMRVNLIAINALIEAARAGDSGRAFAFVGHEIKSLGEQTRTEAERMKDAINRLFETSQS